MNFLQRNQQQPSKMREYSVYIYIYMFCSFPLVNNHGSGHPPFPKRKVVCQHPHVSFYDCWREGINPFAESIVFLFSLVGFKGNRLYYWISLHISQVALQLEVMSVSDYIQGTTAPSGGKRNRPTGLPTPWALGAFLGLGYLSEQVWLLVWPIHSFGSEVSPKLIASGLWALNSLGWVGKSQVPGFCSSPIHSFGTELFNPVSSEREFLRRTAPLSGINPGSPLSTDIWPLILIGNHLKSDWWT